MNKDKTSVLAGILGTPLFEGVNKITDADIAEVASSVWRQEVGDAVHVGRLNEHEKLLCVYFQVLKKEFQRRSEDFPDSHDEYMSIVMRKGTESQEVQELNRLLNVLRDLQGKCNLIESIFGRMMSDRFGKGVFVLYGDFEVAKSKVEPCPNCGEYHDDPESHE